MLTMLSSLLCIISSGFFCESMNIQCCSCIYKFRACPVPTWLTKNRQHISRQKITIQIRTAFLLIFKNLALARWCHIIQLPEFFVHFLCKRINVHTFLRSLLASMIMVIVFQNFIIVVHITLHSHDIPRCVLVYVYEIIITS